jgi:hypothetical protein
MTHQRAPQNPSDRNPLYRKAFNSNYTFGTGTLKRTCEKPNLVHPERLNFGSHFLSDEFERLSEGRRFGW